ncbi:hypothetical protein [Anaeromassilibacillus senegalensis]|uniref:DUF1540 domain-containing protein n=1 Tax=Anaeromassilibacillus senegalensis TaxID=1673717 RepID=A0ABS9CL09_9FIRM|nr:hypothetical protein [Anaeromassilibacillus senegalensis]MCF2651832.1 hypothetical protein [Anaeromassilibacillus senegalensis]MCI5652245.1 hypothetical protein [Ruminococcus bromii]
MKCENCKYYHTSYLFNRCGLTGDECFMPQVDCTLVDEDGGAHIRDFSGDEPFEHKETGGTA